MAKSAPGAGDMVDDVDVVEAGIVDVESPAGSEVVVAGWETVDEVVSPAPGSFPHAPVRSNKPTRTTATPIRSDLT
ncbi:MAG: hypothetical protein OEO77_05160 [Acidimicrobiia bacterium]|nr:hypothetical protein [Acidimicrobiia bacterium]